MSDVGVSGFYTVLAYSLPRCDLRLYVECKYRIVQINAQYNVLVNQVFAIQCPSSFFLGLVHDFRHSNVSSLPSLFNEVVGELPSCFLNLLLKSFLFVFQSHKTFHVEDATRTQHSFLLC